MDDPRHFRSTIGRSTANDWVAQYQAMGLDGLKPRPRSDQGTSRAIPEPVQDLLLQLRRERPKASVDSLIRAARLSGKVEADLRLPPSTVYRFLAAHGAVLSAPRPSRSRCQPSRSPVAGSGQFGRVPRARGLVAGVMLSEDGSLVRGSCAQPSHRGATGDTS